MWLRYSNRNAGFVDLAPLRPAGASLPHGKTGCSSRPSVSPKTVRSPGVKTWNCAWTHSITEVDGEIRRGSDAKAPHPGSKCLNSPDSTESRYRCIFITISHLISTRRTAATRPFSESTASTIAEPATGSGAGTHNRVGDPPPSGIVKSLESDLTTRDSRKDCPSGVEGFLYQPDRICAGTAGARRAASYKAPLPNSVEGFHEASQHQVVDVSPPTSRRDTGGGQVRHQTEAVPSLDAMTVAEPSRKTATFLRLAENVSGSLMPHCHKSNSLRLWILKLRFETSMLNSHVGFPSARGSVSLDRRPGMNEGSKRPHSESPSMEQTWSMPSWARRD